MIGLMLIEELGHGWIQKWTVTDSEQGVRITSELSHPVIPEAGVHTPAPILLPPELIKKIAEAL